MDSYQLFIRILQFNLQISGTDVYITVIVQKKKECVYRVTSGRKFSTLFYIVAV